MTTTTTQERRLFKLPISAKSFQLFYLPKLQGEALQLEEATLKDEMALWLFQRNKRVPRTA